MKQLIRFEDAYGVADIVCIAQYYLDNLPDENEMLYINNVKLDLNKKCW